jgi:hypothetical protein
VIFFLAMEAAQKGEAVQGACGEKRELDKQSKHSRQTEIYGMAISQAATETVNSK